MASTKRTAPRTLPLVALDTECTGPDFRRGDRPFSVALCWPTSKKGRHTDDMDQWRTEFISWPVDPFTRDVDVRWQDREYINRIVNTHRVVFHNAKFDIRALASIGVGVQQIWRSYEDTLLASHVCDSNESHGLKDLALKYLDIPDDDEKLLQSIIVKLRRKAKALDWNIAENVKLDYWLPTAMEIHHPGEFSFEASALESYNVLDAKRTMALWLMYYTVLNDPNYHGGLFPQYVRERDLQIAVYKMESVGVTLDKKKLDAEIKRYRKTAEACETTCVEIANIMLDLDDFNIRSPKQLQALLFTDRAGFRFSPSRETAKSSTHNPQFSTDKEAMKDCYSQAKEHPHEDALPFVRNFIENKLNTTALNYLTSYKEGLFPVPAKPGSKIIHYRLFPSFNQTGTDTTRFSSSNPNGQNIGKGKDLSDEYEWYGEEHADDDSSSIDFNLRTVFAAGAGRTWYSLDYNQLQLRIFARACNEKRMIQAFRDGYDFHAYIASEIFGVHPTEVNKLQRRVGKNVNFGYIFGAGPHKIDLTAGIRGLSKKLAKMFPNAYEFMESTISHVRANGYVTTLGGYRLSVPKERAYAGVCYIVQGTEGEIVKNAMLSVDQYLSRTTQRQAYITLQVHDELVLDFPKEMHSQKCESRERRRHLRNVVSLMMRAGANLDIETPVSCERVWSSWADSKDITQILTRRDRRNSPDHQLTIRPYRKTGKHVGVFRRKKVVLDE